MEHRRDRGRENPKWMERQQQALESSSSFPQTHSIETSLTPSYADNVLLGKYSTTTHNRTGPLRNLASVALERAEAAHHEADKLDRALTRIRSDANGYGTRVLSQSERTAMDTEQRRLRRLARLKQVAEQEKVDASRRRRMFSQQREIATRKVAGALEADWEANRDAVLADLEARRLDALASVSRQLSTTNTIPHHHHRSKERPPRSSLHPRTSHIQSNGHHDTIDYDDGDEMNHLELRLKTTLEALRNADLAVVNSPAVAPSPPPPNHLGMDLTHGIMHVGPNNRFEMDKNNSQQQTPITWYPLTMEDTRDYESSLDDGEQQQFVDLLPSQGVFSGDDDEDEDMTIDEVRMLLSGAKKQLEEARHSVMMSTSPIKQRDKKNADVPKMPQPAAATIVRPPSSIFNGVNIDLGSSPLPSRNRSIPVNKTELVNRLIQGKRAHVTKREMVERTERIYRHVSEVESDVRKAEAYVEAERRRRMAREAAAVSYGRVGTVNNRGRALDYS